MAKRTILVLVSCLTLLLIASLALSGSSRSKFEFSPDGRTVRALNAPSQITPARPVDPNLSVIAGNFSTYPNALYFSIWGNTIANGGANFPFQIWQAEAFTPSADASVKEIDVSLGNQSGGSAGIEVGLYADAGGIPGNKIKSVHVSKLPPYGQCCGVTSALFKGSGIPIKAGTQYWVTITTTSKDVDIYAWAFNSTDMRSYLGAYRCTGSSTYCGNNSGVWVPYQYVQNGFQVLGQ